MTRQPLRLTLRAGYCRWGAALAACWICVRALAGAPDPAAVAAALAELSSAKALDRAAAERRLRDWGPDVLPFLPDEHQVTDPAARAVLPRIRRDLERQRALAAVRPEAFLLRVVDVVDRPVDGDAAQLLRQVRLRVTAAEELRPLFLTFRDADLHAATPRGNWRPFNPGAVREVDFTRADGAQFDVPLLGSRDGAAQPLRLSGRYELELIGAVQELRFDELSVALPRHLARGDVRASLTAITVDDATQDLRFTVSLQYAAGGPVFESYRIAAVPQDAWLELADGIRLAADPQVDVVREQNGALTLQYRLSRPSTDWRSGVWVVSVPTLLIRAPVEFEVRWP